MHTHDAICHVGMDVAKPHLDVASSQASTVKRFDNEPRGFEKLLVQLPPADRCQIVLESTGAYHVELVDFLVERDYAVAVAGPAADTAENTRPLGAFLRDTLLFLGVLTVLGVGLGPGLPWLI